MERPIQIGDHAYITINGQEYPLLITDVSPSLIIAGDYNLVPIGDHWVVQDYPAEHSVNFGTDLPVITHIPEVTSQILLSLDYKDLINACKTNKYFNTVCQDDYFWKLKVEHDYGALTQYKPLDITYRQQYVDLMTIKNPSWAVGEGRLDILQLLARDNIYPDYIDAIIAKLRGQLEVLKWLEETKNIRSVSQLSRHELVEAARRLGIFVSSSDTKQKIVDKIINLRIQEDL